MCEELAGGKTRTDSTDHALVVPTPGKHLFALVEKKEITKKRENLCKLLTDKQLRKDTKDNIGECNGKGKLNRPV